MAEEHVGPVGVAVMLAAEALALATGARGNPPDPIQQLNHLAHSRVDVGVQGHGHKLTSRQARLARAQPPRRPGALHLGNAMVGKTIAGGTPVNQRQLKPFYKLLMARRQELLDEALRTVGGMTAAKENFPDPTDRASLEANRNAMLRIRDRERKLISKIDEALQRISSGSYGLCES